MLVTAYADMLDPLALSSVQLGIGPDGLFGSYRPTLEALIAAIPSRRVESSCAAAGQLPSGLPTGAVWLRLKVPPCRVWPAGVALKARSPIVVLRSDLPTGVFLPA
jgi:hypothetical protein